ncbi:N-acetylmuramoyl-L-alanine amidase [Halalkalibacter flavus]|uniref:N-acetylmuramoyl-L-alanine amidase n=1 Tax=Halalkalibacter flavus TaxID=3090668 RepID=UPI002FCBC455
MKISLSAGHGNNTAGKRSPDGMREFHFNKPVANYMAEELSKYEGVQTQFVHDNTGNVDVPLSTRTSKSNIWGADLHIDIHANALRGVMGSHGGIETYIHTSKPKEADALARRVQSDLVKATGLRNRGVKTANFQVLKETKMTAILVEYGFMDSTTDLPKLKSDTYRRLVAKTTAESIAAHYNLKKRAQSKNTSTQSNTNKLYHVQVGAFVNKDNTDRLANELKSKGYSVFITK